MSISSWLISGSGGTLSAGGAVVAIFGSSGSRDAHPARSPSSIRDAVVKQSVVSLLGGFWMPTSSAALRNLSATCWVRKRRSAVRRTITGSQPGYSKVDRRRSAIREWAVGNKIVEGMYANSDAGKLRSTSNRF